MRYGLVLRNMGPASSVEMFGDCAAAAEAAGVDDVWVTDHVAIPPDDAEGSGGRYLDPLTALAWVAGRTRRIGIGTGVLNLPYRPPLPTAKAIATVQELSAGRLRLGIGVGWMRPEFAALGIPRGERGRRTDETLAFLRRCFESDEVEANGQRFLFKPRPPRPPIYVGGAPPHAFERAARHAEGWMPMGGDPDALRPQTAALRECFRAAGRGAPEVVLMTALPLQDAAEARDRAAALADAGVTHVVCGARADSADDYRRAADALVALRG